MYPTGLPVFCALQAHCFEVENRSLECQIVALEEKLNSQQASSSITTTVAEPGYSLDAVVERLRKERVGVCCGTRLISSHLLDLVTGSLIYNLVMINHCIHCVPLQDEILCDAKELQKELEHQKKQYEKVAQQKMFVHQERQHVAEVMVKECMWIGNRKHKDRT